MLPGQTEPIVVLSMHETCKSLIADVVTGRDLQATIACNDS